MKITIEHMGHKAEALDETVVDICDALELMETALQEAGYAKERVEGAIVVRAGQITGEYK
jgi:hypothetical protein